MKIIGYLSIYRNTKKSYKDHSKIHFFNDFMRRIFDEMQITDGLKRMELKDKYKERFVKKFSEKKPTNIGVFYEEIYNDVIKEK